MNKLFTTTALMLTLMLSGMAYAHDDEHDKGHEGPPPFMEEALSKLPEKDAAQFRDTMKQAHGKDEALHDQMHKLHEELHGILTAEKFDKEAYIAKSKELEKLHEKMHAGMTEAFASAVSQLPQDERKTLADAMHHEHHGHHGHHKSEKSNGEKPPSESDSDH